MADIDHDLFYEHTDPHSSGVSAEVLIKHVKSLLADAWREGYDKAMQDAHYVFNRMDYVERRGEEPYGNPYVEQEIAETPELCCAYPHGEPEGIRPFFCEICGIWHKDES